MKSYSDNVVGENVSVTLPGGQVATEEITVKNIIPTASFTYTPPMSAGLTSQPVVARMTLNKPGTVQNNGGSLERSFSQNGEFDFIYANPYGYTGTARASVNWIGGASISYSPASFTNQDVVATISFTNPNMTVTNNGGSKNYSFTQNGSFTFQFRDQYGNVGNATASVNRIDKSPVTATVSYSPSGPTNQDVVATLQPNKSDVTVTNNGGSKTYRFTQNGSFTFQFRDKYGNVGQAVATVSTIDKTAIVPSISYSPSTFTNQNVVATISFNKSNVTVEGNPSKTHTFSSNGSHTFKFRDANGNTGQATATVSWIDKTPVTATVSYSPSGPTNQDVVATLQPNKSDVTVTNNGGSKTYRFTQNGSFTFQFRDKYGNVGQAVATVNTIDKTAIVPSISYSPSTFTNQNVVATISFNKSNVTVEGNPSKTHTFTQNGSHTFTFRDANGNTGQATATVSWIDKSPVTATVSYSPSGPTNQDVVATLQPNKSDVTVTNNGGKTTYTFTQNGSFTFQFRDKYGNVGQAVATVNTIDKTAIVPSISYSPSTFTNQNVVATISFNKSNVTVTNNGGSKNYSFNTNGTFKFEFRDANGNTGQATASVNWIDKSPVTATVSYSPSGPTNQDVVATLQPNKSDVTVTNNGGQKTYRFTQNGSFTFQFKDKYGNVGQAVATVSTIDKTAIVPSISYSPSTPTNQNVTATISFNKSNVTVEGNPSKTHTFSSNGSHTFKFRDANGNTGQATATVNWIDKTPVTATVSYSPSGPTNQDVVATLQPNKSEVTVTNNGGSKTYRFTQNGSFTFQFRDKYGNVGQAVATVSTIDKTAIVPSISYSPSTPTNQNVVATISFNKSNVTVEGNPSKTHTFTQNGSHTFKFRDANGNTGQATASVNWIDKTSVTATVNYSTTEKTNKDVVASISFNKT